MCDDDKLVRMLSLRERREAVEAQLEWLDQKEQLRREREAAMKDMKEIIREEMKGREA